MFRIFTVAVLSVSFCFTAVDFTVTPNQPADMSVTVSAGSAKLPDNSTVNFSQTVLTLDEPVPVAGNLLSYYVGWSRKDKQLTALAPDNFASWWDPWQPWPAQGNPVMCKPLAVNDGNSYTDILGGLYFSVIPESMKVMNEAGTVTYTLGTDYEFNHEFGQIGNIGNALGTPNTDKIKIDYHYMKQRLDLVQVNTSGTVSIKKGTPVAVCPRLPDADDGCAALAGIYIARYDSFTVAAGDINIVDPVETDPVNAGVLQDARDKLEAGGTFKITFFGASATDGAEAGSWWNLGAPEPFRGRVRTGLGTLYPGATVSEVAPEAHVGGNTIDDGIPLYTQYIKPAAPDVMVMMFGLNDCDGSQTSTAGKNPVASFKEDIRGVVQSAKTDGIDVLLVAPYNLHPFYVGATRMPDYRQALLEISAEEDVALADVYTAWENMRTRGIVPHTQLHNNKNHPGVYGHQLIADVILDCFDPSLTSVRDHARIHPDAVRLVSARDHAGFTVHCPSNANGSLATVYAADGKVLGSFAIADGMVYRNPSLTANQLYWIHLEATGGTIKYVHFE